MITLIIISWLICSVLAHGIAFGHFQNEFPSLAEEDYKEDFQKSVSCSFAGPIALVVFFFLGGFAKHGLKFW